MLSIRIVAHCCLILFWNIPLRSLLISDSATQCKTRYQTTKFISTYINSILFSSELRSSRIWFYILLFQWSWRRINETKFPWEILRNWVDVKWNDRILFANKTKVNYIDFYKIALSLSHSISFIYLSVS